MLLGRVKEQVIAIHRGSASTDAWERFRPLIEEHIDEIVSIFNTRWLMSICDICAFNEDGEDVPELRLGSWKSQIARCFTGEATQEI